MIEIIPNWHPIFVHFTVALLSISILFYFAAKLLSNKYHWQQQWLNMANWSLWSGCLLTIGTAIAGWFSYNSVAHDSASHAAMTLHRNWALPTATVFLLLGVWAILLAKKERQPSFLFLTFSMIAGLMLMTTAWLGAEAVYRYGLGVISLPKVEEGADGHNHSHEGSPNESAEENAHQHDPQKEEIAPETESVSSHGDEENIDGHNHSHEGNPNKSAESQLIKENDPQKTEIAPKTESVSSDSEKNIEKHNHSHEAVEEKTKEQPIKNDAHEHDSQNIDAVSKADNSSEKTHDHQH
ncbi:MAG: DUF2231 domain-containing protein [Methylococcales bacterium]|nr:DUF2231 domain-containing protein [Methylococcales bacterium]